MKNLNIMNNLYIALTILSLAAIMSSCTMPRDLYEKEKSEEIARYSDLINGDILKNEDIANLPEPLKRYIRYCGFIGKPKVINAEVLWRKSAIKLKPDAEWTALDTLQFNSVPQPMRIAFMHGVMGGIISMDVRDLYSMGRGNMYGRLAKIIKLFDVKGAEVSVSALITVFAETVLVPGYIFAEYLKWETIDNNSVKATISHEGLSAAGIFHFNEKGEFLRFETEDRYYQTTEGDFKKVKWSASASDYVEKNGMKFPEKISACWNLPEGDYVYWEGIIEEIKFNISSSDSE